MHSWGLFHGQAKVGGAVLPFIVPVYGCLAVLGILLLKERHHVLGHFGRSCDGNVDYRFGYI